VPAGPVLATKVDELIAAAARNDVLAIHNALSDLIPTFVSSLHLPDQPAASDSAAASRGRTTRLE
jgi:hypothetical protein